MLNGKPIAVRKLDAYRVAFDLPEACAVADRLFDGIYILPRHKLEAAWKAGKLADAWTLSTPPSEIAGLGPFRLKEICGGAADHAGAQSVLLEGRTRRGRPLPYLDEVGSFSRAARTTRCCAFRRGRRDIISRVGARNFAVLEKDRERRGYQMVDAGASLEYSFLVFNLGDVPAACREIAARQAFLRRKSFRQAVSAAIDRDAMVRLVYRGTGTRWPGRCRRATGRG